MPKVYIIIGPPYSGKREIANTLSCSIINVDEVKSHVSYNPYHIADYAMMRVKRSVDSMARMYVNKNSNFCIVDSSCNLDILSNVKPYLKGYEIVILTASTTLNKALFNSFCDIFSIKERPPFNYIKKCFKNYEKNKLKFLALKAIFKNEHT